MSRVSDTTAVSFETLTRPPDWRVSRVQRVMRELDVDLLTTTATVTGPLFRNIIVNLKRARLENTQR